jgi:predicted NAD/FAD-dependent oxidoreductase
LAGLCCARTLHHSGIPFVLLEASDGIGRRVRTNRVEGFLLDRGFQVLQTAYPEARRVLPSSSTLSIPGPWSIMMAGCTGWVIPCAGRSIFLNPAFSHRFND